MKIQELQQKTAGNNAQQQALRQQWQASHEVVENAKKQVEGLLAKGVLTADEKMDLANQQRKLKRGEENKRNLRTTILTQRQQFGQEYQTLWKQTDPTKLIEELSDDLPFVLFPLRIETHFHSEGQTQELWVRIYPDDVFTFTHEKDLTADELSEGELYWNRVWQTRQTADLQAAETQRATAWNALATRFGVNRAAWVARQSRPTNWSERWRDLIQLDFLPQLVKSQPWTQTPYTPLLPNRFVVTAFDKSGAVHQEIGKPISPHLILGPDPLGLENTFGRDAENKLLSSDEIKWMFDFEEAVRVGMAVKMKLLPPLHLQGFEKLAVLGIRFSTTASQNQTLLDDWVQNHNYTANGLGVLPQGTPTNNTDKATAGQADQRNNRRQEIEENQPYFVPTQDLYQQTDGQRLTEALGLNYESLQFTPFTDRQDVAEAMAMNNVLWPATWGLFLDDLLKPLVNGRKQTLARQFFTEFVTGRGVLPALRVGQQPYGVLVTSSFKDWAFTTAELGNDPGFWNGLLKILQQLHTNYKSLLSQVAFVGKGGNERENFLKVVGLQASSVAFHSRKAVTDSYAWNYLNFQDSNFLTDTRWNLMKFFRQQQLSQLGLDINQDFLLEKLLFLNDIDEINGPIIDADPKVSFSEINPITPFNATDNYVDWLLKSDFNTIKSQLFRDKNNQSIAPPKALLYQLLRRAYLEEFNSSITQWLVNRQTIDNAPVNKQISNVGRQQDLNKEHYLGLDAQKLGLTTERGSIWDFARKSVPEKRNQDFRGPVEMQPIMGVVNALRTLKNLPTARLERLFAEHLDLCSYRLDAWQTGLFSKRLHNLQHDAQEKYLAKGVYLGAYGWLENIRPATTRRNLNQAILPPLLQDAQMPQLQEFTDNGGYIQGPSLTHAMTGAVLRNAYLSHGDDNERFAVNLSSERVRAAMKLLEGIRNGQDLAALLGYQFERGLHERGLLLNQYIYVLRARFPLISKKITAVPNNTAQEVMEARNVINGYDLLEYARTNVQLQGIAGLPANGTNEKKAILEELDQLTNTLDALADLSVSESVYQAVQGNLDRAGGMMQAIAEGKMPPEPEIVSTPRSGTVITHRVVACLPTVGVISRHPKWGANASPRSKASLFVNHWLGEQLPDPANVQFSVETNQIENIFALTDFDIQPIDLVLMSGSELGNQSSDLERWLIYQAKKQLNIADNQVYSFDFKRSNADKIPLSHLIPLLRSLKKIATEARPLHALDFLPQSQSQLEDDSNPRGYASIMADKAQLEATKNDLQIRALALKNALATVNVVAIKNKMEAILSYGWVEALPAAADSLLGQANGVVALIESQIEAAHFNDFDTLSTEQQVERCREVAKCIYGKSFGWLPVFNLKNASQLSHSLQNSSNMLSEAPELVMENWLQSIARVRTNMTNVETLALHHDIYGDAAAAFTPLQLPYVAGEKWVGETFSESQRRQDRMSLVLYQTPTDFASLQVGWLLDEWTELIPTTQETTGVAFHYNRPNATPPQAILVAVAPQLKGNWTWNELLNILTDTFERAKLRAIEPDMLTNTDYFQVLPAVLNDFSSGGIFSTQFINGSTLLKS